MTRTTTLLVMIALCAGAACAAEDVASARKLLSKGDYDAARDAFAAIIKKEPQNAEAVSGLVDTLLDTGKNAEAVKAAGEAVGRMPNSAPAMCAQARALETMGRYDDAMKALEAALKADPDSIEACVRRGLLFDRAGRDDDRDETFEKIEDMLFDDEITTPRDKWLAGMAVESMNMPHDAMEIYTEAQKADKALIEVTISLGDMFFTKQQVGDAWREYRAALKVNPKSPAAHVGCAGCLMFNGRFLEAEEECRKALEVNPSYIDAYEALAAIDLIDDHYSKAEENLKAALKINPNSMSARSWLAALHFLRDETPEFERLCKAVLAVNPRYSEVYEIVAGACRVKRRKDDAIAMYEKALKIDPKSDAALAGLGLMKFREAEYKPAQEMLERAFRLNRFNVRVYNTLELCDQMENYARHEVEGFKLVLDETNDPLLAKYILRELPKIREEVGGRFKFHPTEPVPVEVFPTQRWLGARVAGLPHVGAVGVCLGKVIAMDSPKVMPGQLNWRIILTHEYTHAVNLIKTKQRCWHWFTEGCAVTQENTPRRHEWNRLLVRAAALDRFIPLKELTRGFVRPKSAFHRQFAYCQSAMVVDLLRELHGEESVLKMLDMARDGLDMPAAIEGVTGLSVDEFEKVCFKRFRKIARELNIRPMLFPEDEPVIREAIKNSPDDPDVVINLAHLQVMMGDHDEAAKTAARVLKLKPGHVWARVVLATIELHKDNHEASKKMLGEILKDDPKNASAWLVLAQSRRKTNDEAGAAKAFESCIEAYPNAPKAYEVLAELYGKLGKWDERAVVLEKWMKIEQWSGEPGKLLLEHYTDDKKWSEVLRVFEHQVHITPSNQRLHLQLGRAMAALGRKAEALETLKAAVVAAEAAAKAANVNAGKFQDDEAPNAAMEAAEAAAEAEMDAEEIKELIKKLGAE